MSHIFVSYSRKDIDFADKIVQALAENSLDTWIDWKSIPKGEYWEQEIYRGIEEAEAFLFLISPDSISSQMCNKEIAHAVENNKRILPIVVRNAEVINFLNEIPREEISQRNWIFCRDGQDNFNEAIAQVHKTIQTDYEWLKYHTKLLVQALDWERSNHENSFLLHGKELQHAELQLATNSSKEPNPTDLQREYVLKSRQAADRQRRLTTSIAFAGIIALAALATYGFIQAGRANNNAEAAQTNAMMANDQAATAQAASTFAVAQQATAQANAEDARKQANIAFARQLAVQAQSIFLSGDDSRQMVSVLLAIQSMKIFPNQDAAEILQNNLLALPIGPMARGTAVVFSPDGKYVVAADGYTILVWGVSKGKQIAEMYHDGAVNAVAFSPDSKYVVSGSADNTARVWEASTGQEVARMTHDYFVTSVAFSPDGKYVISGGCDEIGTCSLSTARVWDAFTGTEVARMTHNAPVTSVAFSPDGKYVASGACETTGDNGDCTQGSARVWEALTGKEVARMTHGNVVTSVAFSPDGKYVVSGACEALNENRNCAQGSARVWEALTGHEVARMTHDDVVTSVAFSRDGNYLVSASADQTARVWEALTGNEVARKTHNASVTSATFSPDGMYVLSVDGTVHMWETFSGKEDALILPESYPSFAFSPDGKSVVSGGYIWKVPSDQEAARMTHGWNVNAVAFSQDGKYAASAACDYFGQHYYDYGCSEGSARVWEVTTGIEVIRIPYSGNVQSVTFSSDGKYVVSAGCEILNDWSEYCIEGAAKVWDISNGQEVSRMTYDRAATSAAFSPDGKYVISGGCQEIDLGSGDCLRANARVWEAATGKEFSRKVYHGEITSVAFSPDGRYVMVAGCGEADFQNSDCAQGDALVWDAKTGRNIVHITTDEELLTVAFSPDGKYIITGSGDPFQEGKETTARVWDAATGKELARMIHAENVTSVAFSPDGGRYVVSGSWDATARVWEALTGHEVARLVHEGAVTSVAFSPDGKYVVSGSWDATARVWEALTGQEIARITYEGTVTSVAFSSDGKYVVSGSEDHTARVWLYQPEDLIANSCNRVTRNLSYAEWELYVGTTLPYRVICPTQPVDLTVLADVAREALLDTNDPNRVPTAIDRVSDILKQTSGTDSPAAQAKRIVIDAIEEQISITAMWDGRVQPSLNLLKDARKSGIQLENVEILRSLCWYGGIYGYATDVLEYCEQAVALAPDDADLRDDRGIVRALTGNTEGAISDFQYYMENSTNPWVERQQWIVDLEAGKNPFTPEVLNALKEEYW